MNAIVDQIKVAANRLGFEVVGITAIDRLEEDEARYLAWCDAGHAADMEYMTRRRDLLSRPAQLAPFAKSIITLAINYYSSAPRFNHQNRYGRIARYAWGLDYHLIVKPRLLEVASAIERIAGRDLRSRCFVDAVPLLERAVATRAGLGFFGKNTNLLLPRRGSWFFLAEILTELPIPADSIASKVSCGTCTRCLTACPTNAFADEYILDSRRCISYLTIENKGDIPRELRTSIGEWVFGCDICQDVCPFNRFSEQTNWPELEAAAGAGQSIDLVELLSLRTSEEFRERFRETPLTRPKRKGLLRNAAVVAANVGCTSAVPVLEQLIESDPEPLIRSHALWALGRLDSARARVQAAGIATTDPDPSVRAEAESIVNGEI
ncbi:MAG TPA: tRNA epoxyqueuosine(34) reductase QueG [Blastocatellia bacterium]|nr:tRNA epoxyqueuosine(34) reductase QueG [Blastocatellia bacterium]